MANEKDLKKLKAEDKKAVAGGDIYYSKEDNNYYAPNPELKYNAQYYVKVNNLKAAKNRERKAGRGDKVYYYDTTEEAKAAAEAEAEAFKALRIAHPHPFSSGYDSWLELRDL